MWLWVAIVVPLVIAPALFLLLVSTTARSHAFALGLVAVVISPSLWHFGGQTWRKPAGVGSLMTGLACLVYCLVTAPGPSARLAPAMVVFGGKTKHSRFSPATLVPEVDQQLMGAALFGLIDSSIDSRQSGQLRKDIVDLYDKFMGDELTADLPSVMGFAYLDLFLGWKPIGNKFVYVPEPSSSSQPLPVVVFLHGSLGNFQAYWQILRTLADSARVAIVAPTFGAGNWYEDGGMAAVADAIEWCREDARIDASQVHLAGLSNGGTGVTRAGQTFGDEFRSLIFLSPVLEKEVTDTARFRDAWRARPVLIISGTADKRVPVETVEAVGLGMRAAGIELTTEYFDDADHFLFFSERVRVLELLEKWLAAWDYNASPQ